MKWIFTLVVPAFFAFQVQAQNATCYYSLILQDSGGDGWQGNALEVINGMDVSLITLEEGNSDFVLLPVTDGTTLEISFQAASSGSEEVFIRLQDADDVVLYEALAPGDGDGFSTVVSCAACPNVPAGSVVIEDVRDVYADLAWPPLDSADFFLLELGLNGFTPGGGQFLNADENRFRIDGLTENQAYDVYLRTVCVSGDTTREIGPFSFATRYTNDVGVVSVFSPPVNCNNMDMDTIQIGIRNFGGVPQSLIPINFSLNGVPGSVSMPTDGVYTGVVGTDSIDIFEFDVQVSTMEAGENVLKVWTDLEADSLRTNDTTTYRFYTRFELPFREDFEDFSGGGWDLGEEVRVAEEHNAGSRVLFARLSPDSSAFQALSPQFGFIVPGDSLVFDYRIVEAPLGIDAAMLSPDDSLLLEVSTDCGETFSPLLVIDQNNHLADVQYAGQGISLDAFAGELVRFRFRGLHGMGDYFVDIDNVNLLRCTNDFMPVVDVTAASGPGVNDGSIAVMPQLGLPEYTYLWSTGDTTAVVDSLFSGNYALTITDATGCTQSLDVFVDLATGLVSPASRSMALRMAPNPTSGRTRLQVVLDEPRAVQVQVFNWMGQAVRGEQRFHSDRLDIPLDLTHLPAGLYVVRVRAGDRQGSIRLFRN